MFNGLDSIKLILSAQDALGCQAYDSIYVNVVNINLDLGLDVAVCAGDSFSFNIDSNVFNANVPYQYEWTSAINVTDATSLNPIAYAADSFALTLKITDSLLFEKEDTININIIHLSIDAGNDTLVVMAMAYN